MKIAVISDIHSNHHALKAVLKEIDQEEIDTIVCTGDIVGYLTNPNEVIDLIRQQHILAIQGNHDQYISTLETLNENEFEALELGQIQESASALYTNYVIDDAKRNYLKNLPKRIEITINQFKILFVHGSPRAIDEYMREDAENLEEILNVVDHNVVVSGHTHIPFWKEIGGKHAINAGSVGKPKHGNSNATYIIIHIFDDVLNVEIKEVEYEVARMRQDILNNKYIPNELVQSIDPKSS